MSGSNSKDGARVGGFRNEHSIRFRAEISFPFFKLARALVIVSAKLPLSLVCNFFFGLDGICCGSLFGIERSIFITAMLLLLASTCMIYCRGKGGGSYVTTNESMGW